MRQLIYLLPFFFLSIVLRAQDCMNIGVNFHDVQYWSKGENAFKDQMKQSGEFIGFYDGNWDNEVLESIPRDSDGYPNAGIPFSATIPGLGVKDLYVRKIISADGRLPQTQFAFLYEGNGSIQLQGDVSITSSTPGRIEFTCTGTDNIYLTIDQSDAAPNHLRNFRMVSLADEPSYQTNIWKQTFLDRLAPFSTIRVMDWNQVNGCRVWDWSQRTPTSYNCQNEKSGVAYEYIIDLCNTQNKNLWICVPHMATPDYITQMATLFKNNLNPNLTIYLEYSNEVWNPTFDQFFWVKDDFTWLDPSFPHNDLYDSNENIYYNTGLLAKRSFMLWHQIFGAENTRVKRVLACQGGNVWVAQQMINAVGSEYDYIAPDWYFGASEQTNFSAGINAQEVIDSCRVDFYQNRWSDNLAHYTLAQQEGKKVICYEGGQHTTANGNTGFFGLQAFYDAQTDPAMYDLYDDIIDTLRDRGAELLMAYTLGEGEDSPYGTWGHIANVDMIPTMANAPKYMALIDNLPSETNCNSTPLSVDYLEDISAQNVDGQVIVSWISAVEVGNDYYIVQRSSDLSYWENIGKVKGKEDGGAYQINDRDPLLGRSYYRLQQFDLNGSFTYSKTVSVEVVQQHFSCYPNPSRGLVDIEFPNPVQTEIQVFDFRGKNVLQRNIKGRHLSIDLGRLPPGVYVISSVNNGQRVSQKLVLQK